MRWLCCRAPILTSRPATPQKPNANPRRRNQGGFSTCQAYAPDGKTWTLFFKHPYGVRFVYRIPNERECEAYRSVLRPELPSSCRPLDVPINCEPAVSNITPIVPRPETAIVAPRGSVIQLADGHYEMPWPRILFLQPISGINTYELQSR